MEKENDIKLVIWDLDNTIWEGVLTESESVTLKPHIKEIIETLDSRGILQSIASKNNHQDAIEKLKEFNLDTFFIYPEINWNAKSTSIGSIQKNINIGMDSILFIDDQPFEREEVQFTHSEITCIDAVEYHSILDWSRLNPRFITQDSVNRRKMYIDESKRKTEEETFNGTPEKFLASLDLHFIISEAKEEDLKRAEELTVRTNQLNATGITYNYEELEAFLNAEDYTILICELTDRYGSYGKIGLALINTADTSMHLKLLLMSCRVMSRGVGTILLTHIMKMAKDAGKTLLADFKMTDRNRMMFIAYKFSNFKEQRNDGEGNILLENDLTKIQQFPNYIKITIAHDQ